MYVLKHLAKSSMTLAMALWLSSIAPIVAGNAKNPLSENPYLVFHSPELPFFFTVAEIGSDPQDYKLFVALKSDPNTLYAMPPVDRGHRFHDFWLISTLLTLPPPITATMSLALREQLTTQKLAIASTLSADIFDTSLTFPNFSMQRIPDLRADPFGLELLNNAWPTNTVIRYEAMGTNMLPPGVVKAKIPKPAVHADSDVFVFAHDGHDVTLVRMLEVQERAGMALEKVRWFVSVDGSPLTKFFYRSHSSESATKSFRYHFNIPNEKTWSLILESTPARSSLSLKEEGRLYKIPLEPLNEFDSRQVMDQLEKKMVAFTDIPQSLYPRQRAAVLLPGNPERRLVIHDSAANADDPTQPWSITEQVLGSDKEITNETKLLGLYRDGGSILIETEFGVLFVPQQISIVDPKFIKSELRKHYEIRGLQVPMVAKDEALLFPVSDDGKLEPPVKIRQVQGDFLKPGPGHVPSEKVIRDCRELVRRYFR